MDNIAKLMKRLIDEEKLELEVSSLFLSNFTGFGGHFNGEAAFWVGYVPDDYILVSYKSIFKKEGIELVDKISKVVGSKPFIKYREEQSGIDSYTYEWDWKNPEKRMLDLNERIKEGNITEFESIM